MEAITPRPAALTGARLGRVAALTAVAPIAWGSTYWVTRHFLPADTPLTGSALRALPAGLLLLLVSRRLPHGDWWWKTALISTLTISGFFVLIYVAGQRLPSSVASTLMAGSAVVVLVAARLLLGERAARRSWAGAVLGTGGVVLLVGAAAGGLDLLGVGAALLAMVAASVGFVLTKRWEPPVSPTTFVAWQLTVGGVLLTPVALAVEGPPAALTGSQVAAFAYLVVIGTAVAYVAWFAGLRALPAGTVGLIGLLNPVSGALLGVLLAGERLAPLQVIGALVVVVGVAAGLPRARSSHRHTSEPPIVARDAQLSAPTC
ncbi:EamA family transporter [Dermatophilaceae bacterium Soc4.6]